MKSSLSFRSCPAYATASSVLFCIALAASVTHACPPGTMPDPKYDPSIPAARAHPQRCVPAPKPSVARYNGPINPNIEHAAQPHSQTPMQQDRSKLKPQPGLPIEHASSASNTHGIIFVGGKNAINSQPVPPGRAALNPQPIPPGRTLSPTPHPGSPIEKAEGH
ncbi:MAG: hypothetical protein QM741_16190 [Rudaea sp.]|uniref:hypothetical protein n=1 Tax=Rudaea sp. TaxID=2136325 RepID=UPI0039E55C22